jgi:hypothetical protein
MVMADIFRGDGAEASMHTVLKQMEAGKLPLDPRRTI